MDITLKVVFGVLAVWIGAAVSVQGKQYIQKQVADLRELSKLRPLQVPVEQIQHVTEEWTRTTGSSGLKQIRRHHSGTKSYYSESFEAEEVASLHNHDNVIRTTGMGEIVAVLNGVEFRTRHIDFTWFQPKQATADYLEVDPVAFPPVPQSVLDQPTIKDASLEMREYFRAFINQDTTIREYKDYFKPILCYLEGAWTNETMYNFTEPLYSEREFLDASSWGELYNNARYVAYSGAELDRQRLAYMPHAAMDVDDNYQFEYGQWNYRVVCHPIKKDLSTKRFRIIDDLVSRLAYKKTITDYEKLDAVRFRMNPKDQDEFYEGSADYELLDELMGEIPGLDNYEGNLVDDAFDTVKYDVNGQDPLNAAYYHRYYKVDGPNGKELKRRSFSDENVFFAMTSQPQVAGRSVGSDCSFSNGVRICAKSYTQKWSFAIPITIQYLTPLLAWNPYNIEHKGHDSSELGKYVRADGRWGGRTVETALNGTSDTRFYKVPPELYVDYPEGADVMALKTKDRRTIGVLCKGGQLHLVYSHHNYYLPGIGTPRLMYPIVPLHVEGTTVWKELEALKELILNTKDYPEIVRESTIDFTEVRMYVFGMAPESPELGIKKHTHLLKVNHINYENLMAGETVYLSSSINEGHGHIVWGQYNATTDGIDVIRCDYNRHQCIDNHKWTLSRVI